jgi:hypothetical protein
MLRILFLIAAILEVIFRGLPALLASESIANLFGLEYIAAALVYVHPFGMLMIVFGIMFFLAYKNPVKYSIIVDIAILRYAAALVAYIVSMIKIGSLDTFWWIHLIIDVVLLVLFILSRAKAVPAKKTV